jgi:rhodanese-related sulfurtransferase
MKKQQFWIFLISVFITFSSAGCTGNKSGDKQAPAAPVADIKKPLSIGNETSLLLNDLAENGDYVNSQVYPSLIKASAVYESLGKNVLVIDLRSARLFSEGHIEGAVNKNFEDLPAYFETGIRPFEYDRIILVSDDGQLSSYTTSLLRLMGYGNVFSMRWGMSAWNNKYAQDGWLKGVSGKYEDMLETKVNEKSAPSAMPELNTGMQTGSEIGTSRFHKIFEEGAGNVLITADEVFSNPQDYYIINLDRRDKYAGCCKI